MVNTRVILFVLVNAIIIGTTIYTFVFRKPEPKPEVDFGEEVEEDEEVEEVEEPSPDTVDEVMTGGDDEPVPEEDETSLETAPADGEIEDETVNEDVVVEGYMLKK